MLIIATTQLFQWTTLSVYQYVYNNIHFLSDYFLTETGS